MATDRPTSPWSSPLTNPAGAAGRRTTSLRTQARAGERTSPLPLPPASNPGTTHHPLEAAEPYTPSGREYAAPCSGPVRVLYTCDRTRTHKRTRTSVHMYMTMAPNQPKLTADWFTLRMSTTHTPPRRNGPCRKDQHAMGGKDSYQSISAWQQTTPTSPWYNPIHQSRWGGGTGAPTRVNQPITHSQRALSPRATSVVNPDTSSATAPTRTLRQTTAAVPECKEGPG